MRYFRVAMLFGIISTFLVVSAFTYYRHGVSSVRHNRTKLGAIHSSAAQRTEYAKKIEAIKAGSAKLIALSAERGTDIEYEIMLTEPNVARLMEKVASTYAEDMFFLDKAVVETTSAGISVTMKGFKLGGGK